MPIPEPTYLDLPTYMGLVAGRYTLWTPTGDSFTLPAFIAHDGLEVESMDTISQAPGSPGAVRAGFGTDKPLSLTFGTGSASLDSLLAFDSEADALNWERAFLSICKRATRITDDLSGEEYDGWVSRRGVSTFKRANYRKLSFTFSALDSQGWLSNMYTLSGSPAVCSNGSAAPAFPYTTCTATGGTVTLSDGTRTLTITTATGHVLTVDSGRADGLVTDNGGAANYSGRFPRIPAGGGTLTITGASGILTRYRQPSF